ncbi:MAG: hypothetical protein ACRD9S_24420 [Pyrinomonadaceae bacterium]
MISLQGNNSGGGTRFPRKEFSEDNGRFLLRPYPKRELKKFEAHLIVGSHEGFFEPSTSG